MTTDTRPILLVALGGNALIKAGQRGTAEEQLANLQAPMEHCARLSETYRLVITHGNGPQVGNLQLQQAACDSVPQMPLEVLVAQTQGQIGYMIESTLDGALMRLASERHQPLVSLVSYVLVDPDDPAFDAPQKPVGPVMEADEAQGCQWPVVETAKGWRRVVASPEPRGVVEHLEIRLLLGQGFIVICCGGGGIPVTRKMRGFEGVEAVIDKDLTSVCLAQQIGVSQVVIATDVAGVFCDYGQPHQRLITAMTATEGRRRLTEGQFAAGSMGPKVEAAVRFIEGGGQGAVICAVDQIEAAVNGRAGTQILSDVMPDHAPA